MPVAFPSHQGLILPLWRRFPATFDGVAMSVGAAMPDIVDLALWPLRRGELGQWLGHALVGLVPCVVLGLLLAWIVRRILPRSWIARLDWGAPVLWPKRGPAILSLTVGALSHDLFDLVTHANFVLLLPFWRSDDLFPNWWTHAWTHVPLYVYEKPYPLAPHTIVWALLSIAGAWLFVRNVRNVKDNR